MAGQPILLADHGAATRAAYRLILENAGYGVIEAETGRDAISLARRKRPAVILMDISLPVVDGLQATRQLKSRPATASIPIVLLLNSVGPAECEQAQRAGCDGYLVRPCSPHTLLAEVQYHYRRRSYAVAATPMRRALPAQLGVPLPDARARVDAGVAAMLFEPYEDGRVLEIESPPGGNSTTFVRLPDPATPPPDIGGAER